LTCVVVYLVLSPYDNEQHDLVHRVLADPNLDQLTVYKDLLTLFTVEEVMRWKDLCAHYETELRVTSASCARIFSAQSEPGVKRWADLKLRLVEHNIRVMAKYYTRIHISRMSVLLDLTETETEEFLSNLVVAKTVDAKVDRLVGTVSFRRPKQSTDVLTDWSHSVNELMRLVNNATHLITKEEMIHRI